MGDRTSLTLAVCTWRRATRLQRLLTSIADASAPPVAWEVLVVDGDASGATAAVATPFTERLPLRYVFEKKQGSSAARNRALAEAGADLVVFVDDDVTIDRGFLGAYAAAAAAHPDAGFFGGPIEIRFERQEPGWIHAPRLFAGMFGPLQVDPERLDVGAESVPRSANFGVRRSRTGGERFDAAIGMNRSQRINADEVVFLKRLLGAGAAGRWVPDAVVQRWVPPERTTVGHVVRHLVSERRAQTTLRACDDDAVAPAVAIGESPGAVVLRVQHAAGRLALRQPSWFRYLGRAQRAFRDSRPKRPLDFVVGHPRSGTNLITHVLNACGAHVAEHEYLAEQTLLATLIEAATEHYEGRLSGEDVKALVVSARLDPGVRIDSNWKNVWILRPLMELYPDARFLHITRDPRENVIACHNLDYYGASGWRPEYGAWPMSRWLRSMPRIRRPGWDRLSPFEKNCEFWVETHRLILEALGAQPHRYRRLHLEDLRDDDATLDVYRFLRLPPPTKEALRRVLATPANAKSLDKHLVAQKKLDILPRFDACPPETQETLLRICGPMADRLGYRMG